MAFTNELLLGGALAGGALGSLAFAVRTVLRRRARHGRGEGEAGAEPSRSRFGELGARLRPSDPQELGALRQRLLRAGLQNDDAVELFLSFRVLSLLVLVGGVVLVLLLPFGNLALKVLLVAALVLGMGVGPSLWLDARATERRFEIGRSMPPTLDLLVTCLDAGLNLEQALARVVARGTRRDDPLARELGTALDEMRAGLPLQEAFRRLAQRLEHPDVQNLSALIAQASTLGGNVSGALRAHAEAMRAQRLAFLEEEAGRTNAKLTLPLVLCLLMSMLLLLFGPAIIAVGRFFESQGG